VLLAAACGGGTVPAAGPAAAGHQHPGQAGPASPAEAGAHTHETSEGEVAYYTCPMHPSVRRAEPGSCPICGMTLTPVTSREVASGVILVDEARRQQIGVRTAAVGVRPMTVTVRAVGTVTWDETRLSEVTLKVRGWIGELYVDETGQPVRRGQPLLTLYSPELLAAQEELLAAVASQREARLTGAPDRADYLVDAARRRLALWDLSERQIAEVEAGGRPIQYLTVYAPASGFVVEKNVVQGGAVEPGAVLYRLAGLDTVWVDAEVYESELGLVEVGQRAEVSFPHLPGETVAGRVDYVYPYLDAASRTGRVRVELPNPGLALKPDMYVNVVLRSARGERLTVPEEAVIYAGDRRLVFVDLGEGRLEPRRIEVGVRAGDDYEVLSGLAPGEIVVTSGNFLIAAESRLKSAIEQW
jgi:Cu(I)/Ag(I) efflux system membrane fusion protein